MVHCEAALLGTCWVVCLERCPWCAVGFGMDVFLLFQRGGCVRMLCEGMRVMCFSTGCFHVSMCAGWYCVSLWGGCGVYAVEWQGLWIGYLGWCWLAWEW